MHRVPLRGEGRLYPDWLITKFAHAYAAIDRRPRLAVLTLHRAGGAGGLTAAQVAEQLEYLATHFRVLPPEELKTASRRTHGAWITIDDGHVDTYETIYPIARKLGLPFTICLPTDFFLRSQWLWFDQVHFLAQARPDAVLNLNGQTFRPGPLDLRRSLLNVLKRLDPAARAEALEQLATQAGCTLPAQPPPEYSPITPPQLREMLGSGLASLCAHTVSHTIATALPLDAFRAELVQCRRELQDLCGREITSFCYPNGLAGDFSDATTQVVRELGFDWALTSVPGINRWSAFDPLRVRRVHAHRRLAVLAKGLSGLEQIQHRSSTISDTPT